MASTVSASTDPGDALSDWDIWHGIGTNANCPGAIVSPGGGEITVCETSNVRMINM